MSDWGLGYYWIFGIAGGLDLVGLILAWVTIKDARDPERVRGKTKWEIFKAIFDLNHIKDSAVAFFKKRPDGDRARLFLLVIALMCTMIPMQGKLG